MALYSAAASMSGINTAGKVYHCLMATAAIRPRIYRIAIAMPVACATAPAFQIRRVTAAGVTPGATLTPLALDGNDVAAVAALQSGGFGTDPTTTATPLDMASLPLTAGAAWVWNFASPILIPVGTANGLAIYNANASGATLGTFVASFLYDE